MNRLLLLLCFTHTIGLLGQKVASSGSFEDSYFLAKKYEDVALFAEASEEINKAIEIASFHNQEKKVIMGKIFLAELMRKTGDFEEGLSILKKLDKSGNHPSLHAEKLGRIAALYNEGANDLDDSRKYDSVRHYLDSALILANKYDLKNIQAGLYNELGYSISNYYSDSGLYYLQLASDLFLETKDTHNYVGARTNMLRTFETREDSANVMRIFNELFDIVQDKEWYTAERELYAVISSYYNKKKDTASANYWALKSCKREVTNLESTGSLKLNAFRTLYEIEKYENEIEEKGIQIEKEVKIKKELNIYLAVLLILILGSIMLLIRERKLKRRIVEANDRYQVLLVESNHRIKNNLQMIISMLKYASKNLKKSDAKAFDHMSGKIRTISALHKQLYLEVHNERIEINQYFSAIIELNDKISSDAFLLEKKIDKVEIKSERIVYFGLIFNEMLSNTIEHKKGLDKKVKILIEKQGDLFFFMYQDYSSFDENNSSGTGLNLIKQLVNKVGGVRFSLDGKVGKYEFYFNE
ncbi:MAG: sensor histidine kinase [Crocinitomicaceae bacterium]|nr:sensor histidine kinase [Crocinitomicaceae bacterium]